MSSQRSTKKQWQVWLMILMLGGVITAGFLIYPKTEDQRNRLLAKLGTTNHGEFVLPPVPMTDLGLQDVAGEAWILAEKKNRWRIIVAGDGECLGRCRELVHLTRQVHISLGKYSRRFSRLYLALDQELTEEFSAYLKLNHPFLKVVNGREKEFKVLLEKTNTPFQTKIPESMRAYLVDQQGLIMMSYSIKSKGTDIIEDIKHLMKYSAQ